MLTIYFNNFCILQYYVGPEKRGRKERKKERKKEKGCFEYRRPCINSSQFSREGHRRPGSGRRRVSTPEQNAALVAEAVRNPFQSISAITTNSQFPGSTRTALRRLKDEKLFARIAAKKELLRDEHKLFRLAFSEENTNRNCNRVIFSDEETWLWRVLAELPDSEGMAIRMGIGFTCVQEFRIGFPLEEAEFEPGCSHPRSAPEQWVSACNHVKNLEEEYWRRDGLMDEEIDRLIIHFDSSGNSDGGDSCSATETAGSSTDTADEGAEEYILHPYPGNILHVPFSSEVCESYKDLPEEEKHTRRAELEIHKMEVALLVDEKPVYVNIAVVEYMTRKLVEKYEKWGLNINLKKTNCMTIGTDSKDLIRRITIEDEGGGGNFDGRGGGIDIAELAIVVTLISSGCGGCGGSGSDSSSGGSSSSSGGGSSSSGVVGSINTSQSRASTASSEMLQCTALSTSLVGHTRAGVNEQLFTVDKNQSSLVDRSQLQGRPRNVIHNLASLKEFKFMCVGVVVLYDGDPAKQLTATMSGASVAVDHSTCVGGRDMGQVMRNNRHALQHAIFHFFEHPVNHVAQFRDQSLQRIIKDASLSGDGLVDIVPDVLRNGVVDWWGRWLVGGFGEFWPNCGVLGGWRGFDNGDVRAWSQFGDELIEFDGWVYPFTHCVVKKGGLGVVGVLLGVVVMYSALGPKELAEMERWNRSLEPADGKEQQAVHVLNRARYCCYVMSEAVTKTKRDAYDRNTFEAT
ncbi:hypothetical protein C0J52_22491 [Blattella germanica]|nr:hypothetical protein C0J52_22491 [Blattella germanica]